MNPDRNLWPVAKKPEDPIDHEVAGFAAFVEQHQYTASQLRTAYEALMQVAEPDTELDPAVAKLRAEMERLSQSGFPVNRFVELIAARQEKEAVVPICIATIDRLPISTNERHMLHSIVEKRRSGWLTVSFAHQVASDFDVRYDGTTAGDERMTNELLRVFKEAQARAAEGQAIEFIFSEH